MVQELTISPLLAEALIHYIRAYKDGRIDQSIAAKPIFIFLLN